MSEDVLDEFIIEAPSFQEDIDELTTKRITGLENAFDDFSDMYKEIMNVAKKYYGTTDLIKLFMGGIPIKLKIDILNKKIEHLLISNSKYKITLEKARKRIEGHNKWKDQVTKELEDLYAKIEILEKKTGENK